MIQLNGKILARNEEERVQLEKEGHTVAGYAVGHSKSITIKNLEGKKVGIINAYGVLGRATERVNDWWYSYADIPLIGRYESYMTECNETDGALRHFGITRLTDPALRAYKMA
jgi:hypothetical protein